MHEFLMVILSYCLHRSLLDACKRYSYDADIELFSKVMHVSTRRRGAHHNSMSGDVSE